MAHENQQAVVRDGSNASALADQVRAAIKGEVITPDDTTYDKARTVFYGGFDVHPAVIARPLDSADVSAIVSLACETGAELAVRSGGHSVAGHSTTDGGIVIDLSAMKALDIDPVSKTAWAEAGLTAGEFTAAAAEHSLAVGFGDTGSVGIGGITLGGGIGFLTRKYGMTIDHVLAAEIVTADGQILTVDENSHPDLFWAIRGGGGNFGVVTKIKYQLHEVDQVVGGMLILPASAETIQRFVAEAEAAPEELSIIANVMPAPPMPFVPAEAHGKLVIFALLVYAGDIEEGQRVVGRLRSLATPIADMVRPMRYVEMYPPEAEEYHPVGVALNMFVNEVDQRAAERIIEHLKQSTAMMSVAQIRVLGGAMARVPADATAYAHRDRKIMLNVAALYGNPAEAAQHEAWANTFAAALDQGVTGAYVNFVGNEGVERVHAAYPGDTWTRLAAIKAKYDPTNLFHRNQNITPAAEPA